MSVTATADFDPRQAAELPGWRKTDRPCRIALLGWARLSYQGTQGSGYNLSASELATGLALSGHHVFYLSSGRRYNLAPWSYVAHTERWRSVECHDLVNSPNLSPAFYNFGNMAAETSHERQCRLVLRWLDRHQIEVVHIHSLEGFPLGLIGAIRASGRPVVVTPHNYWFVCPQVDLMHRETSLCMNYEGGRRCETCLKARSPLGHRLKRRIGQALERIVGIEVSGACRRVAATASLRVRELTGRIQPDPPPNARLPDPESAAGLKPIPGELDDGLLRTGLARERFDSVRRPVSRSPIDANEQFLRADHHLTVLNGYGQRRAQGIAALSRASLVIPPSDFVRRVYVKMGLPEESSRVVRLGQPHFDQINRRAQRSPFYDQRPWDAAAANRPLRFAFLGAMRPSKGIDVLAEAIGLLPTAVRQRCQFHIRAQGFDWPLRKKLSIYPEVAFSGGYDLLQLIGEAGEYDIGLLPHVWFENSPLVLLEHLHAGKFVVSSRMGGVVEWIDAPRNGLLFAGGQADQLAGCIEKLVSGRVAIPSPREIHEATPILTGYPNHIAEVESVYRELLGKAAGHTG